MGNIFKKIREFKNARKLSKTYPDIYDPLVCGKGFFNISDYKKEPPKNQILMHAAVFKELFNTYMEHLSVSYNTVDYGMQAKEFDFRPKITKEQFKNIPERFRGIFVPLDKKHYVLNTGFQNPLILPRKSHELELNNLLKRAQKLIPVVYKTRKEFTKTEDYPVDGYAEAKETYSTIEEVPDTVKKSISAYFVTQKQLDAIKELQDIFQRLNEITRIIYHHRFSIAKSHENLQEIYHEYENELTQKNRFLRVQEKINEEKKWLEDTKKYACESFATEYSYKHKYLIDEMKEQIKPRIK